MKLKQILGLSFATFLMFVMGSCNGDSEEYSLDDYSKDAQIYGFKLTGIPVSSIDTVNYPVLANTKFSIDQFRGLIYNADSLPYQTTLRKFLPTIKFNTSGVSKVQFLYPNDSVVDWAATTDSVNFAIPMYPKIKVTSLDGLVSKTYSVDIRIHQINPNLIAWNNVTSLLNQPQSIVKQKTILREEEGNDATFYTFAEDNDNKLYLHKAKKGEAYSSKQAIFGLPAISDVDINNITLFNGNFYIVDANRTGYSSEDGVVWTKGGSNIYCILGVLPAANATSDSLLVVVEDGGVYSFAKTLDLNTIKTVRAFDNLENKDFPVSGFSSITNFDRSNLNKNLLILTSGKNKDDENKSYTWLIQVSENNTLRLTPNEGYGQFYNAEGLACFMYNNYMYAIKDNNLYRSGSFGYKWTLAPYAEWLDSSIPRTSGQSVVVDSDNYIWIFGGISKESDDPIHQVWRGRLNKLNPKE